MRCDRRHGYVVGLLLTAIAAVSGSAFAAESVQVTDARVSRVKADFLLMRGLREEALMTIAATFERGAQMTASSESDAARLEGINVQRIACEGLRSIVQNGSETRQEYDRVWEVLERLRTTCPTPASLSGETAVLHKVAAAEFEIVRMAAAARRHFITLGKFPIDRGDFGPLMRSGVPMDPFSSGPLIWGGAHCAWACCSVGPDGKNDKARVVYDPTNGVVSGGDIVFRIPGLREYPFPGAGVHASTANDVLKAFPRGLPPDPFAPGRPYGIARKSPPLIYSVGPDAEPSEARSDSYVPSVQFDPTNGAASAGDLFFQVPK